jgi:hypothetical protein
MSLNTRRPVQDQENYRECYEALELSPGAPYPVVRAAYVRLKELYGGDSIVLSPLEDELSGEWKEKVLIRIESAYAKLTEVYRQGSLTQPATHDSGGEGGATRIDDALRAKLDSVEVFNGESLRQVREMLGLEIHEVSHSTKISKQHLKNIEDEKFSALPEEVFLRGYLSNCAKLYTVDTEKVIEDYLGRFRSWKQGS